MTLIRHVSPELAPSSNLDRWLRDFFWNSDPFTGFGRFEPGLERNGRGRFAHLAADLYENGDAFHAVLELPGVSKADLKVELENQVLTLSGKHTDHRGDNESTYEFNRSLALPDGVNSEKVSAKLENGMLHIHMPKVEERKPRSISVA